MNLTEQKTGEAALAVVLSEVKGKLLAGCPHPRHVFVFVARVG
jgi:hypothetical protein